MRKPTMNKRRATAVCEVVELVLRQNPDVDPPGINDRVDREDLELGLRGLRFIAEHGSDVARHNRRKRLESAAGGRPLTGDADAANLSNRRGHDARP